MFQLKTHAYLYDINAPVPEGAAEHGQNRSRSQSPQQQPSRRATQEEKEPAKMNLLSATVGWVLSLRSKFYRS